MCVPLHELFIRFLAKPVNGRNPDDRSPAFLTTTNYSRMVCTVPAVREFPVCLQRGILEGHMHALGTYYCISQSS